MSSGNPLVAGAVDTATPFSGAGLLDSGTQLADAIGSGSWVEGGMAAFAVALDTAALALDPLGSLIGAGLGWLIDHFEPLKGWFNDLTGDAGEVAAFAQTWANTQAQLDGSSRELVRILGDVDDLAGEAIDAYRRFQQDAAQHLAGAAAWAGAMSTGLKIASTIVQVVHDLVRDVISQLVGSAISWAAEAVFTLGLATPLIVGQVTSRVASLAEKVGTKLTALLQSVKKLAGLLDELKALMSRTGDLFDRVLRGGGTAPGRADVPGVRAPVSPYATRIDDAVVELPREPLPQSLVDTFTDGQYRTVRTTEPVELYRVYGGSAEQGGGFATTASSGNRLNAKLESALLPEWKNTREFEAVIEVPSGEVLNIGKVAPQQTMSGAWLPGGADQILLPRGWDPGWITRVDTLPAAFQGRVP